MIPKHGKYRDDHASKLRGAAAGGGAFAVNHTLARSIEAREKRDEQEALRLYGVRLSYDAVRGGMRLLR